ncbi:NADH-FMN oxidoreductase RutF, flavin reductase (DIM6/NTAB) family [Methylomagnum ishizawai]|uniref:NADH-FMN oxidoreductase RutF, flavin reductase (DIM6/NTAB) family n=1 Tax=Methylomagnum ishizawai TaxID=1760988 RepID=A0A1Y6D4Y9_9GAMM|nr:flavin reductase [Methylomagnum ishizawai]SMF97666.1 NADH-FMN oxidoreductase RutF, flavin reductase (DIM6/NTAB) family [Methylomagnum ishizawai]
MNALKDYRYIWPQPESLNTDQWRKLQDDDAYIRTMPEALEELSEDSRWPAFFPSPIALVTTADGPVAGLEKVVGASIVNRFPYVIALSFCKQSLSDRHYARSVFTEILESGKGVAVQFLAPGRALDATMRAIATVPDLETDTRIKATGNPTRKALTNNAPVFKEAYLVYEAVLVKPGKDFDQQPIYPEPWVDVGSHRVYFLEITAIQLRQDIADGRNKIIWRSLPDWNHPVEKQGFNGGGADIGRDRYRKGYTPHYTFPSAGTIAFEADLVKDGMAVKYLPPLPEDQIEVDNDRARWPCFFPSSAGMITSWMENGTPNIMPCGSTTIISRHPLVVAPCISYAKINERYAPRASLDIIRIGGKFGCGVPFINPVVTNAIRYTGNISITNDPHKAERSGLRIGKSPWAPVLYDLPIHYDCKVIGEIKLGTHIMLLGEVQRIRVHSGLTPENPLEWFPWADVSMEPSD